jgi:multidrug efflux pump subunit AcrB
VTITIAVIISGIVALTFTPALCVVTLKHGHREPGRFFRGFNRGFEGVRSHYTHGVAFLIRQGLVGLALFRLDGRGRDRTVADHARQPRARRRPGFYIAAVILPDGATLERTFKVVQQVEQAGSRESGEPGRRVIHRLRLIGGGFRNNAATMFVTQKHWDEREVTTPQLVGELFGRTMGIKEALVLAFNPPAIFGLGTAGGYEFHLQSRGEGGAKRLGEVLPCCCRSSMPIPMLGGAQTALAREVAAALRRYRPREGEEARHPDRPGVQRALRHAWQRLRQRLQQVRPHVAGADVGRAQLP